MDGPMVKQVKNIVFHNFVAWDAITDTTLIFVNALSGAINFIGGPKGTQFSSRSISTTVNTMHFFTYILRKKMGHGLRPLC